MKKIYNPFATCYVALKAAMGNKEHIVAREAQRWINEIDKAISQAVKNGNDYAELRLDTSFHSIDIGTIAMKALEEKGYFVTWHAFGGRHDLPHFIKVCFSEGSFKSELKRIEVMSLSTEGLMILGTGYHRTAL